MQEESMIAKGKIWTNFCQDERQHVDEVVLNEDETYTGTTSKLITLSSLGVLTVSWRYEPNEVEEVKDPREVIGTFQVTRKHSARTMLTATVVSAAGLTNRPTGVQRSVVAKLTYGNQRFSSPVGHSPDIEWNFGVILYEIVSSSLTPSSHVRDPGDLCYIRLVDQDGTMRIPLVCTLRSSFLTRS